MRSATEVMDIMMHVARAKQHLFQIQQIVPGVRIEDCLHGLDLYQQELRYLLGKIEHRPSSHGCMLVSTSAIEATNCASREQDSRLLGSAADMLSVSREQVQSSKMSSDGLSSGETYALCEASSTLQGWLWIGQCVDSFDTFVLGYAILLSVQPDCSA